MRAKNSFLALLAAAIVGIGALGVAGCGGSSGDDSTTQAAENAAATTTSDDAMKHEGDDAMKHDETDAMKHDEGGDAMKQDEAMEDHGEAMHGEGG